MFEKAHLSEFSHRGTICLRSGRSSGPGVSAGDAG
jgi:hypothetical protein